MLPPATHAEKKNSDCSDPIIIVIITGSQDPRISRTEAVFGKTCVPDPTHSESGCIRNYAVVLGDRCLVFGFFGRSGSSMPPRGSLIRSSGSSTPNLDLDLGDGLQGSRLKEDLNM